MKTELMRWTAIARVQRRWVWPEAETTEVEAHMATYSLPLQEAAHSSTNFNHDGGWLRLALQVRDMHKLINTNNSAHDFSVKFSPCICSHTDSSCPGCWHQDIYLCVTNSVTNLFAACSGSTPRCSNSTIESQLMCVSNLQIIFHCALYIPYYTS